MKNLSFLKAHQKKLTTLFKLTFVVGLLYFLAKKGFISVQSTQSALAQWNKLIPVAIVLFLMAPLGALRWHWLLEAQNIRISWLKVLQLTFIGNFFNIALPGAVSGDFVKAFYVGKVINGEKSRALGSILFDRVAGVSALVLLSAGALLFGFQDYAQSPLFHAIQYIMMAAGLSVILFYTYLFLVREKHDPLLHVLRSLEKRAHFLSTFTRVYSSIRHYHHHRFTVLKVLLISVAVHMCVGWSCLVFANTLGESHLSLLSLYVIVPLGLLVTAIPLAPGGIGTGNVAFLYLFHLLGSERGADVYSLFALTQILLGCLGGLVYFQFRHEPSKLNSFT